MVERESAWRHNSRHMVARRSIALPASRASSRSAAIPCRQDSTWGKISPASATSGYRTQPDGMGLAAALARWPSDLRPGCLSNLPAGLPWNASSSWQLS